MQTFFTKYTIEGLELLHAPQLFITIETYWYIFKSKFDSLHNGTICKYNYHILREGPYVIVQIQSNLNKFSCFCVLETLAIKVSTLEMFRKMFSTILCELTFTGDRGRSSQARGPMEPRRQRIKERKKNSFRRRTFARRNQVQDDHQRYRHERFWKGAKNFYFIKNWINFTI